MIELDFVHANPFYDMGKQTGLLTGMTVAQISELFDKPENKTGNLHPPWVRPIKSRSIRIR